MKTLFPLPGQILSRTRSDRASLARLHRCLLPLAVVVGSLLTFSLPTYAYRHRVGLRHPNTLARTGTPVSVYVYGSGGTPNLVPDAYTQENGVYDRKGNLIGILRANSTSIYDASGNVIGYILISS